MEDGTITILEPRIRNSGIPQGTLLKRQRIPRDGDSGFVDVEDLLIGSEVTSYGKTFVIVNADQDTKVFDIMIHLSMR